MLRASILVYSSFKRAAFLVAPYSFDSWAGPARSIQPPTFPYALSLLTIRPHPIQPVQPDPRGKAASEEYRAKWGKEGNRENEARWGLTSPTDRQIQAGGATA